MRLPDSEVLKQSERYLRLIGGQEMSLEEKQAFITETVEAYEQHVNRGFIGTAVGHRGRTVRGAGMVGPGLLLRISWAGNTSTAWAATASSARGSITRRSSRR